MLVIFFRKKGSWKNHFQRRPKIYTNPFVVRSISLFWGQPSKSSLKNLPFSIRMVKLFSQAKNLWVETLKLVAARLFVPSKPLRKWVLLQERERKALSGPRFTSSTSTLSGSFQKNISNPWKQSLTRDFLRSLHRFPQKKWHIRWNTKIKNIKKL